MARSSAGVNARPLGPLVVVTDRSLVGGRSLTDVVRAAVEGGARCILMREKDMDERPWKALAAELTEIVHGAGGLVVTASRRLPGSAGVHLAAADRFPGGAVVGRSCHDRTSMEAAAAEGCAYATLSPIFVSASKPTHGPALGVRSLADAPLPVYALGGVDAGNAASCLAAGAAGVAVMGAVMRAADPATTVASILAAASEVTA